MMDIQKILDVITGINNTFGLEKQGKEMISLISRVFKCPRLCLLFIDNTGELYTVLACKPVLKNKNLSKLTIGVQDAALKKIGLEGKALSGNDAVVQQIVESIKEYCQDENFTENIDLVVPLISNDHLIGILFLEHRNSGAYTLEELSLLSDITRRLAPGMEKEYLRNLLIEREKELSILNNCSVIISSSLDISSVYDNFINELKKMVKIDWAAITLIDSDNMNVMAIYSDIGTSWWAGENLPVKGTATEWVTVSGVPLVESDLNNDSLFITDVYHREQGIRSIICVPLLINKEEAIGSLIIGSSRPNSFNPKQVEFLRKVALQISMPVKNSRLYADVLKKSRYDELTGLLNRRSMDEQIIGEINRHSRYGGVFSLIILDLDSMKMINDTYGHLAGDGVLARTGSIIRGAIRSVDQAFRYGGDEFAILLPNTPVDAAVKVSERIRKRIAIKLEIDNTTVTASFGLASWPENGTNSNDVVAAADAALYKAKKLGGNQGFYTIETG